MRITIRLIGCRPARQDAWATNQRLVLGQQACEATSHEITAILLDRLVLTGALVPTDAVGTQTKIAKRHAALNFQRAPRDKHSLIVQRKTFASDTADLAALLQQ